MKHIGIQIKDKNNNNIYPNPFPIGAIYMSVDSRNPSQIFGGTWSQIKDRFLLCAGSTYSAGSTGGEANHTLTTNEMPEHNHGMIYNNSNTAGFVSYPHGTNTYASQMVDRDELNFSAVRSSGGGQPHNNMPPYLAVYVWRRVS